MTRKLDDDDDHSGSDDFLDFRGSLQQRSSHDFLDFQVQHRALDQLEREVEALYSVDASEEEIFPPSDSESPTRILPEDSPITTLPEASLTHDDFQDISRTPHVQQHHPQLEPNVATPPQRWRQHRQRLRQHPSNTQGCVEQKGRALRSDAVVQHHGLQNARRYRKADFDIESSTTIIHEEESDLQEDSPEDPRPPLQQLHEHRPTARYSPRKRPSDAPTLPKPGATSLVEKEHRDALDGNAVGSVPPSLPAARPLISKNVPSSGSTKASGKPQATPIESLEAQLRSLEAELANAEKEELGSASEKAKAKAEWSRCLSQATLLEGREEKRLAAARQELDELTSESLQQGQAFRKSSDRFRTRLRNLRMQLRQTQRQQAERACEEDMPQLACEMAGDHMPGRPVVGNSAACSSSAPTHVITRSALASRELDSEPVRSCSSSAPSGLAPSTVCEAKISLNLGTVRCSRTAEEVAEATYAARLKLEAALASHVSLHNIQEELMRQQVDLQEQQKNLQHAACLSDREVVHMEKLSEIRAQESQLRSEQITQRQELRRVESEVEDTRRSATQFRSSIEESVASLAACDLRFRSLQATEAQALSNIDEYLSSQQEAPQSSHPELAEWLEADISFRQVRLVKKRLSDIIADSTGRANVLEKALADLHQDLDKRAAIIVELGERQTGFAEAGADVSVLEQEALEAELQHQRSLFDLRGTQVQNLELHLATLLAREAPRIHALRAWIEVHERISDDRLQASSEASAKKKDLLSDIQAMRKDKSSRLAEAREEWTAERRRLEEAGKAARQGAQNMAKQGSALYDKRTELLFGLDAIAREERNVTSRLSATSELIQRDRRRAVDVTVRNLKASAGKTPGPPQTGCWAKDRHAESVEEEARTLVDTARNDQIEMLNGLRSEAALVANQQSEVKHELHSMRSFELAAQQEFRALEEEAEASSRLRVESLMLQEAAASERLVSGLASTMPPSFGKATSTGSVRSASARRKQQPRSPARAAASQKQHSLIMTPSSRRTSFGSGRPEQLPSRRSGGGDMHAAAVRRESSSSAAARQCVVREAEVEKNAEQLQALERNFEAEQASVKNQEDHVRSKVAEMEQSLQNCRAQQRSASAGLLRRYRVTQTIASEAERRCAELQLRRNALGRDLDDARLATAKQR